MMAQNFHAITVITGSNEKVNNLIPAAKVKYDALSWGFKHEMWHSAETKEIKRTLGHPIKWLQDAESKPI